MKKDEYIVINEDYEILKYNLDEKELLNEADYGNIILRLNNGKIEYADVTYTNKEVSNLTIRMPEISWKEPKLYGGING